jgi:hypothetical protein
MQRIHLGLKLFIGATIALISPGMAVQHPNGKIFFNHPPRLQGASTSFASVNFAAATYYFTVVLPDDAGESLRQLRLAQATGGDRIEFNLRETEAFEGVRSHQGQRLAIVADLESPPAAQSVANAVLLTFDPPITPGKTVTITLRPKRNPSVKGTYQFGVTAFPAGDQAQAHFLGFAQIQFRRRGGV